jgi:hypothetical protein
MFNVVAETLGVRPLSNPFKSASNTVLEVAYELYLQAPQGSHPLIDLKKLSQRTGASPLECRNAIVEACGAGQFPDCSLSLD